MAESHDAHGRHDPALVASLFDGDLSGPDLATAQIRVATCPGCAALHADLLALSQATRAQPTPARPRDFRLTPADAARLRAEVSEPVAGEARLTGEMTDRPRVTAHSTHDTTLVASLADHSLPASERAAGQDLVAACAECAALQRDLVALVAATRAMPTPPRPIDYTLTRAHAARLRPNPWRRLVAVVGSAHDGLTRPLAVGLTALGLVGILVASAPSILPTSAGLSDGAASSSGQSAAEDGPVINAAPAPGAGDTSGGTAAGAPPAPEATGGLSAAVASPEADRNSTTTTPAFGAAIPPKAAPSGAPDAATTEIPAAVARPADTPPPDTSSSIEMTQLDASTGPSPLMVLSVALLLVGLGLFLLRWGARRLSDG